MVGRTMNGRNVQLQRTSLLLQIVDAGSGMYTISADSQNINVFTAQNTLLSQLIDDLNTTPIRMYNGSTDSPIGRMQETIQDIASLLATSAGAMIAVQN